MTSPPPLLFDCCTIVKYNACKEMGLLFPELPEKPTLVKITLKLYCYCHGNILTLGQLSTGMWKNKLPNNKTDPRQDGFGLMVLQCLAEI